MNLVQRLSQRFSRKGKHADDAATFRSEESWPWYKPGDYLPIDLGQKVKGRYLVIGKLGFGSVSTAWLCRDIESNNDWVVLKVFVSRHRQAQNELKIYKHMESITSCNPGVKYIRKLRDHFELSGENGLHQCLVHDPLGMTLTDVLVKHGGRLPKDLLKEMVVCLLEALDYLHSDAGIVHTDVQPGNLMLSIHDKSVLDQYEESIKREPPLRSVKKGRTIYQSRCLELEEHPGYPVLCDFGDARFGQEEYQLEVMPDLYRAPEIIIGIAWNEKIDIWSVGLLVWDLFEGDDRRLFKINTPSRQASEVVHMGRMIGLLGQPPQDLLSRGGVTHLFFDDEGSFKRPEKVVNRTLEDEEAFLEGEEKAVFLSFIRKMLQWRPEDRLSANELLKDPWLSSRS